MEQLRGLNPKRITNKNDLEIQIIDWNVSTIDMAVNEDSSGSGSGSSDEDSNNKNEQKKKDERFLIRAYGNTIKGTSVTINISGFPPHCYVSIPETWTDAKIGMLIKNVKERMSYYSKTEIINYDVVMRKKFWGFTNNHKFKFIRILFKTTQGLYQCAKVLKNKIRMPGISKDAIYEIYESNIPPLLRFIHINDLFPAGWIKLKAGSYQINLVDNSNTQININIEWKKVCKPDEPKIEMAPFLIASYDIEADSSHGDFPLPKKNYIKLCQEITEYYRKHSCEHKSTDELDTCLNMIINDAFNQNNKMVSKLYTKGGIIPSDHKIKIAARNIAHIYKRQENYKILVADIISNTHVGIDHDDINDKTILDIMDDGFFDIDTYKKDKQNKSINQVFTKLNAKPTKSMISQVSKKMLHAYNRLITSLDGYDTKLVYKIMELYNFIYYLSADEILEKLVKKNIEQQDTHTIIQLINTTSNHMMSILQEYLPEIDDGKDIKIKRMNIHFIDIFPPIEGDRVIQIGTAVQKYGETGCFIKHVVTLDTCSPIDGVVVVQCKTEREVLLEWSKFIRLLDPDMVTGYNIFGFDYTYMYDRAEELGCVDEFAMISRVKGEPAPLFCKELMSAALGDNTLKYIDMIGRVNIDLLKVIQRDHNLVSYKLDFVAETFINDKIIEVDGSKLKIKNAKTLNVGNYITIFCGEDKYRDGKKLKIIELNVDENTIVLAVDIDSDILNKSPTWRLAKDDVSPQDIFRCQKGTADDRSMIATYCVQDCVLCLHIINKLQTITNNIAMANTCSVPLSFIFLRGQGIKVFSLVSKQCRKDKFLIPVIKKDNMDTKYINTREDRYEYGLEDDQIANLEDGYEGAIVLKPKPGIYLDNYVTILDYASLYPSSMISENLSHDSIVLDKKYLGEKGAEELKKIGYDYVDITHDVFKWVDPKVRSKGKYKDGVKTCRFVQPPDGGKSVIPSILRQLLKARKDTRAKIKTETDEFKRGVLDGQQLSYKITANSVYGGIGASTNAVCMKDIAASTTATGRKLLYLANDKVLEKFDGAEIVYGDTDSIFIDFHAKDADGIPLKGKEGLKKSIELGVEAENFIQQFLKPPHRLEYEKTFWPFILFTKKRYIGYKYEFDVNKYKETSMGIVLKRRDNAKIVKHVYGGVLDILLKERNLAKSIKFLQDELFGLLDGKFPLEMLIITKSLKGFYKNPKSIAHKVLADRIGERDPGNKPMSNDRIPYVYIENKTALLQGDKIENPKYLVEQNLNIDYAFYITNQIMKPVGQIYSLIAEDLPGFNKGAEYYDTKYNYLAKTLTIDKAKTKIQDARFKDATDIVFGEVLRKANNRRNKAREITDFFKVK